MDEEDNNRIHYCITGRLSGKTYAEDPPPEVYPHPHGHADEEWTAFYKKMTLRLEDSGQRESLDYYIRDTFMVPHTVGFGALV